MHACKLPVLRIGSRLIVPKEKFLQWIEKHYPQLKGKSKKHKKEIKPRAKDHLTK